MLSLLLHTISIANPVKNAKTSERSASSSRRDHSRIYPWMTHSLSLWHSPVEEGSTVMRPVAMTPLLACWAECYIESVQFRIVAQHIDFSSNDTRVEILDTSLTGVSCDLRYLQLIHRENWSTRWETSWMFFVIFHSRAYWFHRSVVPLVSLDETEEASLESNNSRVFRCDPWWCCR